MKRTPNRTATHKHAPPSADAEPGRVRDEIIRRLDFIICMDPEDWTAEESAFLDEHKDLLRFVG